MRKYDLFYERLVKIVETVEDKKEIQQMLEIATPKLHEWFEAEIKSAYDYSRLHGLHNLFRDLRDSEIVDLLGTDVFLASYGYLIGEAVHDDEVLYRPTPDWNFYDICEMEFDRLEETVHTYIIPQLSKGTMNKLLKALNEWELKSKMNLKLNSLKEDFQ